MVRKLLVVTIEPPPTSSGLGTLWAKLAKYVSNDDVVIDFFGPDPTLSSPYGGSGIQHPGQLIVAGCPPLSRIASLKRNSTKGATKLFRNTLRFPFFVKQKFLKGRDTYNRWFIDRSKDLLPSILENGDYSAVAVHVPPFEIAKTVLDLAVCSCVPFVYAVGDPIGYRDGSGGFLPGEAELQQHMIDRASALLITQQTYERYYSSAFEVQKEKVVFFSDCFEDGNLVGRPESRGKKIMHWGTVSPWRPIDAFVSALGRINQQRVNKERFFFEVVGKVIESRQRQILARELRGYWSSTDLRPYPEARQLAQGSDFHMVAVSSRHMDNVPSKMIDLMSFKIPLLLLANPESEAARTINKYGIGLVVHPEDTASIEAAILELEENKIQFVQNYKHVELANDWNCASVGKRFREDLCLALKWG